MRSLNSSGYGWLMIFLISCALLPIGCKIYWSAAGKDQLRRPQFAGRWYFGNKKHLSEELERFSKQVAKTGLINKKNVSRLTTDNQPEGDHAIAVICPHAALRYSGLAAAHAYAMLKLNQSKPSRIFVIGPVHIKNLSGAYLPVSTRWATPLGDLILDQDAITKLEQNGLFKRGETVHIFEHSIELQLPFICRNFPQAKLVPVLIGKNTTMADLQNIGSAIKANLRPDDVVVVSSDFTHWGKYYKYVPFEDHVEANIQALDKAAVAAIAAKNCSQLDQFKQRTKDTICGFSPIYILLSILPPESSCTLLDYYRSQENVGQEEVLEEDRSISYISLAFFAKAW